MFVVKFLAIVVVCVATSLVNKDEYDKLHVSLSVLLGSKYNEC